MSGFKKPVFNDSLILPQLIEYNAQHSPDHPLFEYRSDAGRGVITWSKAAQGVRVAAQTVKSHGMADRAQGDPPPVVGILANLDTITYHTLFLGILRAGATAFLISTKNSAAAVSHLLRKTGTQKLFVSSDEPIQALISAVQISAWKDGYEIDLFPAPTFQDLFGDEGKDRDSYSLTNYPDDIVDSPAVILHSSGSTSFPKPVIVTHRVVIQWARATKISGFDLSEHRLASHSLPAFHLAGFSMSTWAACTGLILTVFPPISPPVVPSPVNVLDAAFVTNSTILLTVPFFVEIWSRNSEDVAKLKTLHTCIYGGGPLNKGIGDELARAGVPLAAIYGATEMGVITAVDTNNFGEWDWLTLSPETDARFLPQESDTKLFELICVENLAYSPAYKNSEIDGKLAYATNDLVVKHPTDQRKFKLYGRKDDQLILSTGEKTNPGPIEFIICRDPLVQAAVMFGTGRDQNGIIIQPAKGHEIDPTKPAAIAQFRNSIWPNILQANEFAPKHSRIYKEMILVTHPSKPFELTVKNTIKRQRGVEAYQDDIEAMYTAIDASSQSDITPPRIWTASEVRNFVREVVQKVAGKVVADTDDIFGEGGDSLQATYIRNSILRAVRLTHKELAGYIPQDFVYTNPTIVALSTRLMSLVERVSESSDQLLPKLKEMDSLLSEFTNNFPEHHPSVSPEPFLGEVVLLTGSTGAFGSQLLSHLTSRTDVSHVYALNRRTGMGGRTLRERQAAALEERGLDVDIMDSPKVTLMEGDITAIKLGLGLPLFNEVRTKVTLVIHNAWRVNFNLALASFRPMIQSVRNIVDMVLQSPREVPPRIIFVGSVSVVRNWSTHSRPLEAPIKDPRMAIASGYSESKWIGERILEEAAKRTPLRPIIVRIGQMTSNSSGAWNSSDWLPALVRSGQVLGALPARDDSIAWISLDTAARAIMDFRTSGSQYLHLQHPHPVPWNTVFRVFSALLNLPLVSWNDWLSKLEESNYGPEENPAEHLKEFFHGSSPARQEHREALGLPLLNLEQALMSSPTLADPSLPQVGQKDAEGWIQFWKSTGFLVASA